ncbi:MAG: hypothetical protein Q8O25_15415 [Sulfurisoma sp.]|nr:hypothetical protein [Sulfurisoma sp.]
MPATTAARATPARPAMVVKPAAIDVCYNYGCVAEGKVSFSGRQLSEPRRLLGMAGDSVRERSVLAQVIGRMYAWAAEQTPVGNDKAGNFADGGIHGQMDCIDHSITTTRFLRLLEQRGWLRFHRVLDPVRRSTFIFEHFSAAIEDLGDGVSVIRTDDEKRTWVVDSWYVDNGKPAWVAPLEKWERDHGLGL